MKTEVISCIVSSLPQLEQLLTELEVANLPVSAISCLIPDLALDEDRVLGRLQFEYVSIPGTGRFLAAGPILRAIEQNHRRLAMALEALGVPPDVAQQYQEVLEDHHFLLVAECATLGQARRVRFQFQRWGAQEIAQSEPGVESEELELVEA
jgi:hypothetical protein